MTYLDDAHRTRSNKLQATISILANKQLKDSVQDLQQQMKGVNIYVQDIFSSRIAHSHTAHVSNKEVLTEEDVCKLKQYLNDRIPSIHPEYQIRVTCNAYDNNNSCNTLVIETAPESVNTMVDLAQEYADGRGTDFSVLAVKKKVHQNSVDAAITRQHTEVEKENRELQQIKSDNYDFKGHQRLTIPTHKRIRGSQRKCQERKQR